MYTRNNEALIFLIILNMTCFIITIFELQPNSIKIVSYWLNCLKIWRKNQVIQEEKIMLICIN